MRERLRHIHIDGVTYAWTARILGHTGPECRRTIRVRAWGPTGKTGRPLQADLVSPAPPGHCARDHFHPTSADVRAVIERALAEGWEPDSRGGAHVLTTR